MSSISKKKKKEKRKINEKNKDKINKDIPKIKTSYEILSSINNELDLLYNNMKYKNIFKNSFSCNNEYNINTYSLFNNNIDYDKEDFEIKELINKANIYLKNKNNNSQKQFIKSYENKICQSNYNYPCDYNNFKNDNISFDNNYKIRNANFIIKENIKKSFSNNFVNRRKKENQIYSYFLNQKYNSKRNKYNEKSRKMYSKNSWDKNINQKVKKLDNINLYINDFKRKPIVYTQIDLIKLDKNLIPNINASNEEKYLKFKQKYTKYIREKDEKTIEILKGKK